MYPLRFEPLFRRYLWGGRRLAEVLNKPIGDESAAESWEVVYHGPDQSVVAFGPLAWTSLHQLVENQGEQLLGKALVDQLMSPSIPDQLRGRFPLLLKFLDANKDLSVQVHPDDAFGATMDTPDLGKTEAWYVMHADPGAKIYSGLKRRHDRSVIPPGDRGQSVRECVALVRAQCRRLRFHSCRNDARHRRRLVDCRDSAGE